MSAKLQILALYVCLPLALATASGPSLAQTTTPAISCDRDTVLKALGPDIGRLSTKQVEPKTGGSGYCEVAGTFTGRGEVGFRLALPSRWNGKFLFLGVGGFAGEPADLEYGVARGYATASADTGHSSPWSNNGTWAANDPARKIDFFELAMHEAASRLKLLTSMLYERAVKFAYFQGCSGGGRQGMVEAERFPSTFDGIISESPAWNWSALFSQMLENTRIVRRHADSWISNEEFRAVDDLVVRQCDTLDGIQDGLVGDPLRCHPRLAELSCRGAKKSKPCLNSHQIEALEELQNPAFANASRGLYATRLSGGDRDDYGLGWPAYIFGTAPGGRWQAVGPEEDKASWPGAAHGFVLGYQFYRYFDRDGLPVDPASFRADSDGVRWKQSYGELIDADQTDLSRFFRGGGKLLLWAGLSDPIIPWQMSVDLAQRITQETHGTVWDRSTDGSFRFFLMPGVQHCGPFGDYFGHGFTHFDALGALDKWVESGHAPDAIRAEQRSGSTIIRSRPICAYPKKATYSGQGDLNDAANFHCA